MGDGARTLVCVVETRGGMREAEGIDAEGMREADGIRDAEGVKNSIKLSPT
tara:strand:- start:1442 stop:1594 length:153 start_codon:yes stop_codon:yes gene_type:complete